MTNLRTIAKKAVKGTLGFLTKPEEVEPYQCKMCKKWTKYKSKGKGICRKCYAKIDSEDDS